VSFQEDEEVKNIYEIDGMINTLTRRGELRVKNSISTIVDNISVSPYVNHQSPHHYGILAFEELNLT
jgi:hypothetical protein